MSERYIVERLNQPIREQVYDGVKDCFVEAKDVAQSLNTLETALAAAQAENKGLRDERNRYLTIIFEAVENGVYAQNNLHWNRMGEVWREHKARIYAEREASHAAALAGK